MRRARYDLPAGPEARLPLAFVSSGKSIPCCVDVDAGFMAKARYGLRMLLVPLGLEPDWVSPERASGAVYYGREGSRAAAARVVLAHARSAPGFFAGGAAFRAESASWHDIGGQEVPVFFTDSAGRPDLVASAFLWLSGWQERADGRRDEHGRAGFAYSLHARLGTVLEPAVDAYRERLARQLRTAGVEVGRRRFDGRRWAFCPTHDVDYVRKWRPGILYREFVEYLLLNRHRVPPRQRVARAAGVFRQMSAGDPYVRALYEMPAAVADRHGTATYFIKAGAGDPHDVRYRVGSSFLRRWMEQIQASGFEIGLHPSYATPDEPDRLRMEKERLERVSGAEVASVRQHYLRYDPAATAALHAELGFEIDSTIAYAEHEGFRRGTCLPFQLYDLEQDRPLDLWEMPLSMMESALFNRRNLDLEGAIDAANHLADVCRRYGGVMIGLWHTTLGDELDFPGWKDHFLHSLDEARRRSAYVGSLSKTLRTWQ